MPESRPRRIVADLHLHTTCSDGSCSPEGAVDYARSRGLSAISICDHDTAAGSERAVAYADSLTNEGFYGVPAVIPGIEISTQTDGLDIHLLAYWADAADGALSALLLEGVRRREERAEKIVALLAAAGFPVAMGDLEDRALAPNRPNIARVLVEKGRAPSVGWCFDHLFGDGRPFFVPRLEVSTAEAIAAVRGASGVPVLAHPAKSGAGHLVGRLAHEGLMGVEVYHSEQGSDDVAELLRLAADYGLGVSGGSDWHGEGAGHGDLGSTGLMADELKEFLGLQPEVLSRDR